MTTKETQNNYKQIKQKIHKRQKTTTTKNINYFKEMQNHKEKQILT